MRLAQQPLKHRLVYRVVSDPSTSLARARALTTSPQERGESAPGSDRLLSRSQFPLKYDIDGAQAKKMLNAAVLRCSHHNFDANGSAAAATVAATSTNKVVSRPDGDYIQAPELCVAVERQRPPVGFDLQCANAAMKEALAIGDYDRTTNIFESIRERGLQPDGHSYSLAIKACRLNYKHRALASSAERALSLLTELEKSCGTVPLPLGMWAQVYRDVVAVICSSPTHRRRYWRNAVSIVERWDRRMMHNCATIDRHSVHLALSACADVGQAGAALSVLDKMRKAAVKHNASLHSSATAPCTTTAAPTMPPPNLASCALALKACARSRPRPQWEKAMHLLRDMQGGRRNQDMKTTVLPFPDSKCLEECLLALARSGDQWKVAVRLIEESESATPSAGLPSSTYAAAISACCAPNGTSFSERGVPDDRHARWRAAMRLLGRMETRKGAGTPDHKCLSAALSVCASVGQWKNASVLLHRIEVLSSVDDTHADRMGGMRVDSKPQPSTRILAAYTQALKACARSAKDHQDEHHRRRRQVEGGGGDEETVDVSEGAIAASEESQRLLQRLGDVHDLLPTPEQMLLAMDSFAAAGHWEPSLQLLTHVVSPDDSSWDLFPWSSFLGENSCGLFSSSVDLTTPYGHVHVLKSFSAAVRACSISQQATVANALLESIMASDWGGNPQRCTNDESARVAVVSVPAINVAIAAAGVAGSWERCIELYLDTIRAGLKPDGQTFRALAIAFESNRRIDECCATYAEAVEAGAITPWRSSSSLENRADPNTLDLHGMSPSLAKAAVRVAFSDMAVQHFSACQSSKSAVGQFQSRLAPLPQRDLVLVTGTGATRARGLPMSSLANGGHCDKNSILKPAMKALFASRPFAETSLRLTYEARNTGIAVVRAASLQSWLRSIAQSTSQLASPVSTLRDLIRNE